MTAQAIAGGRFTLGIGLSHQVVIETMLGLSFAKPYQPHEGVPRGPGAAHADGQRDAPRRASIGSPRASNVPGGQPCPILVAALAPKMLALTGAEADGTITWMTGPEDHPRAHRAAHLGGGGQGGTPGAAHRRRPAGRDHQGSGGGAAGRGAAVRDLRHAAVVPRDARSRGRRGPGRRRHRRRRGDRRRRADATRRGRRDGLPLGAVSRRGRRRCGRREPARSSPSSRAADRARAAIGDGNEIGGSVASPESVASRRARVRSSRSRKGSGSSRVVGARAEERQPFQHGDQQRGAALGARTSERGLGVEQRADDGPPVGAIERLHRLGDGRVAGGERPELPEEREHSIRVSLIVEDAVEQRRRVVVPARLPRARASRRSSARGGALQVALEQASDHVLLGRVSSTGGGPGGRRRGRRSSASRATRGPPRSGSRSRHRGSPRPGRGLSRARGARRGGESRCDASSPATRSAPNQLHRALTSRTEALGRHARNHADPSVRLGRAA